MFQHLAGITNMSSCHNCLFISHTELPTTEEIIPPTRRPEGTIPCPLCSKIRVQQTARRGGDVVEYNITCRDNPVWCDQYAGCWVCHCCCRCVTYSQYKAPLSTFFPNCSALPKVHVTMLSILTHYNYHLQNFMKKASTAIGIMFLQLGQTEYRIESRGFGKRKILHLQAI